MELAMHTFARLVRLLLGPTAIAQSKLECAAELIVLGVELKMRPSGCICRPSASKMTKCIAVIEEALQSGKLFGGCAQKLAGRLNWAVQYLFQRLGRAMLKPIYKQRFSTNGDMSPALGSALKWWLWVLKQDIVQEKLWKTISSPPAHLFVDARSTPARCAAVLFIDGRTLYTDGAPAEQYMEQFQKRGDNQIMSLELLALVVGLSTFTEELKGRKVVLWSDNSGAESASRKGSASAWDQNLLVHSLWTHAFVNKMALWVERVASADNIADLPSRESYALLHEFDGISWYEPKVAQLYLESTPSGVSAA